MSAAAGTSRHFDCNTSVGAFGATIPVRIPFTRICPLPSPRPAAYSCYCFLVPPSRPSPSRPAPPAPTWLLRGSTVTRTLICGCSSNPTRSNSGMRSTNRSGWPGVRLIQPGSSRLRGRGRGPGWAVLSACEWCGCNFVDPPRACG